MRKRRQQLAARAEEAADNLVGSGTAGGSQDARGDAGHGVFLLLALPLGFLLGRLLRLFLLLGKLRLLRLELDPLCRESAIDRFR